MSKLYYTDKGTFKERVNKEEVRIRTLYLSIYKGGLRIGQTQFQDISKRIREIKQSEEQGIQSDECKKLGKFIKAIKIGSFRSSFDTLEEHGEEFLKEYLDKIRPNEFHLGGRYDLGKRKKN